MGRYLTEPGYDPAEKGEWELEQPLAYETNSGEVISAPAGFKTDFYSTGIFEVFVNSRAESPYPSGTHDYLFVIQDRSRKEVDDIFLEAMEAMSVPKWKRTLMYLGVRAGGWIPWNKNKQALANNRKEFLAKHGITDR